MRRFLVVLLLLTLAGTASAFPLLPEEFSGTVTIDGSPAPPGTAVTARIDGHDCGSLTLAAAGVFGGETLFDDRLLVIGEDGDAGKTIVFLVDGVAAAETATYAPGTSANLALAVTKGGATGGSSGPPGGGGGLSGPVTTPAPVTEYTGSGSLETDAAGAVRFATVITAAEGDASLSIGRGVRALDRSGAPLGSVSVESISPEDLPGAGDAAEPVTRAVRCGPAGATFAPAIAVSFTLTPEEWERYEAGQFVVRWYNSETGAWDPLATTVHPSTRTVSAAVPHFTLVAVFAVPVEEVPAAAATTTDPPTAPTLTFGAVATATAVQQAGLPLSWLTGLAALAGAALLIRKRG